MQSETPGAMTKPACKPILFAVVLFSLFLSGGWSIEPSSVAILDSANTRNYFGRSYPACSPPSSFYIGADEYQRYFRGWEYVLAASGLGYTIISDTDIQESLSTYRVLILSNTVSLSRGQQQAISEWVVRGGRLIATFGSGYREVVAGSEEMPAFKGETNGLHHLWHDPFDKLFTTGYAADIRITGYSGPTSGLRTRLVDNILPYGGPGNLLKYRPVESDRSLGVFLYDGSGGRPTPAILSVTHGRGMVVYYGFAPEYLVSKEFGLPAGMPCPDGQNWSGRSTMLRVLMKDTVQYMLDN
jgi:hypothetical protein